MELLTPIAAYDLSDGNTSAILNFKGFEKYSIQAIWADVTGTNNGTIKISQSNEPGETPTFDQMKVIDGTGTEVDFGITMSGTDGSATIEDRIGFTGMQMKITVTVGTITGGTLNVYVKKIYA